VPRHSPQTPASMLVGPPDELTRSNDLEGVNSGEAISLLDATPSSVKQRERIVRRRSEIGPISNCDLEQLYPDPITDLTTGCKHRPERRMVRRRSCHLV